jgi:hypothetical protein
MCQRISNLYGRRDDVTEIDRASADIAARFDHLNTKFNGLKKDLQKARHSFTRYVTFRIAYIKLQIIKYS